MKKKTLLILPALFALAACNTTEPATSSATTSSSTPAEQTTFSLKGYELTKSADNTKNNTYDLKSVITLVTMSSYSELAFESKSPEVATVNAQGVITRVGYGTASILISKASEPSSMWYMSTFQMTFLPDESFVLGKYDCHLDAPQGKKEVYATMELKANNTFTLTYTAGTVLVNEEEYNVTAQTADGTYTVDSLYKFTITTESFPYKKKFSGIMLFDDSKPTLKVKVPVAEDKTSGMAYFQKDE